MDELPLFVLAASMARGTSRVRGAGELRAKESDRIDVVATGMRAAGAHVTAREEVTSLLRQLKLPLDERGRRRAANRAEWFAQVDKPLDTHDILGA